MSCWERPRLSSCFCLITFHLQVVPASCALRTVIQQVRVSIFALPVMYLLGNVQAVALRDLFAQARNRDSFPPVLQQEEPEWEKRRSVNLSELIDIYRWVVVSPFGLSCSSAWALLRVPLPLEYLCSSESPRQCLCYQELQFPPCSSDCSGRMPCVIKRTSCSSEPLFPPYSHTCI